MASDIICKPRSDSISQSHMITQLKPSDGATLSTSYPTESQTTHSQLLPANTVYIIENIQTGTPSASSSSVTVTTPSALPVNMSKVLTLPTSMSECGLNLLNEFTSEPIKEEVVHITVESSPMVQKSPESAVTEETKTSDLESSNPSGTYKCENCDYSSSNKHYLKQHVDLVHNAGRPYKCPYCDYAGKRNHSLREHLIVHSNERPYECSHCNATFRKKGHLTNHVKLHASPKLFLKCGLCTDGTVIADQDSYLNHLQSVHNTTKLFACDACEFITGSEDSIKNHMVRYHSDSKLYQCGMCSFVTKELSAIELHLESHSNSDSGSPDKKISQVSESSILPNTRPVLIKCSECGFTTEDADGMKTHMIQHIQNTNKPTNKSVIQPKAVQPSLPKRASFKCTECSFVSAEATSFIHHMLIHKTAATKEQKVDAKSLYNVQPVSKENNCVTANAPFFHSKRTGRFVCTICGYGCEYQRTIKSHIWKHSGNQDIVYPMFQNGPLSVYEDNLGGNNNDVNVTHKESTGACKSNLDINPVGLSPGTTVCKIKISEDKMIAYMKEELKPSEIGHQPQISVNPENQSSLSGLFSQNVSNMPISDPNSNIIIKKEAVEHISGPVVAALKPLQKNETMKLVQNMEVVKLSTPKIDIQIKSPEPKVVFKYFNQPSEAVVVEEVQTISTTHGLTGMNSQHNSPKRSLSPAVFEESNQKRQKLSDKPESQADQSDTTNSGNLGESDIRKQPTESALALLELQKDEHSPESQKGPYSNTRSRGSPSKKFISGTSGQEGVEESQISESSAKNAAPGGICSSLLAVIEQLRERSKSDVNIDTESYTKAAPKKAGNRRRSRIDSSDDELPVEFADSIEKIIEEGENRYRCKFCHYSNPKPLLIRIHMRLHKSKKPFECSLCDFVARSMEGLQTHMIQHCKVRTYQCKLCPSAFNYKSQLRAHMRAHNEKDTYICDFCEFVTSNLTAYRQHTLVHLETTSSYSCSKCHKKYSTKNNLLKHVCPGLENPGDLIENELDISSDDEMLLTTAKELQCLHCDYSTTNGGEYTLHLSLHDEEELNPVPLKCELCDFTAVSNRSLKSHMKRHINDQRFVQQPLEQYKCNLCGYVCHHLPSLKSHMWRHASDRNYSYEFTNDVINAAIDYDIRIDGRDINDPEILERVLNSERKIVEGRLNNTEQPGGKMPVCWVTFRCCQCGFETINKPELNVHMRSHSDIIQQTLDVSKTPTTIGEVSVRK